MEPRKRWDFMVKEKIFHLVWVYLFPLPHYLLPHSASISLISMVDSLSWL